MQVGGSHYQNKKIQPWDVIDAWGLDFYGGNVVKYLARWQEKGGIEDLKKARHYLDKLIENKTPVAFYMGNAVDHADAA